MSATEGSVSQVKPLRRAAHASVMLVCLFAVACRGTLNEEDRQAVDAWLTCVECRDGELAALDSIGSHKRDALLAALYDALFVGPSATAFDNIAAQARATHQEVVAFHGMVLGSLPTEGAFVEHYQDNFNALYRKRAAFAVAVLGGASAADTLIAAIDDTFRVSPNRPARPDINRAIQYYLDNIVH